MSLSSFSWCAWSNLLVRGGGGGKWFILYQSDIYYSIWTNDMIPFFYLFHISGAGKHLRAKELKLKMSGGGKSCSQGQECLWVENSLQPKISLQKIPRSGKYLKVANVWRSKKLQPVSKSEQTHRLDSNQFRCYNLIFH